MRRSGDSFFSNFDHSIRAGQRLNALNGEAPDCRMRCWRLRQHGLDDEQPRVLRHGYVQHVQDARTLLVVMIMQDILEQIRNYI